MISINMSNETARDIEEFLDFISACVEMWKNVVAAKMLYIVANIV